MKATSGLFSHPGVPLEKHLTEVEKRVRHFCEALGAEREFREVASLTALAHDLGKATDFFQKHLQGERVSARHASHSLLSALLAIEYPGKDLPLSLKLSLFLAVCSHHRNPGNALDALHLPLEESRILEEQIKRIPLEKFSRLVSSLGLRSFPDRPSLSMKRLTHEFFWPAEDFLGKSKDFSLYFTTNLLLGMLVDADIRAVLDMPPEEKRAELPPDIVDRYLENLSAKTRLDGLRRDFYRTIIQNILRCAPEERFLSITAPTGIGKTLAGFSAALRLRDLIFRETGSLPRVIYVLPFTSIIDQNYKVISQVFETGGFSPKDLVIKHHYRAEYSPRDFLEENIFSEFSDKTDWLKKFEKLHHRTETWDGEVIMTTFVRFYETLFTDRRSEMRRLHRLAGSIVILDEVQNIPAEYWEVTEKVLRFLAERWNTRFLLMTATIPALFPETRELTKPKKTFFFTRTSRTHLEVSFEPRPYTEIEEWLIPKIEKAKSFLVILNTVRSAQEVYQKLSERLSGKQLYFLSASVVPVCRERRIEEIRENLRNGVPLGLVATQVVEAGVDLDFEVVVRDLSPLDSIVQAAGRSNRNAENTSGGKVFLVNLTAEDSSRRLSTYIYDSVLLSVTEELLQGISELEERAYLSLVEKYFEKVRFEGRKAQRAELAEALEKLRYDNLRLFSFVEERCPNVPVFVELEDEAGKLIEILKNFEENPIWNYEERLRRRAELKYLGPKIWAYTVNVPARVVHEVGLSDLPYLSGFKWLSREDPRFSTLYDEILGFCREITHEALFL